MKVVTVKYNGFECEQPVTDELYEAIFKLGYQAAVKDRTRSFENPPKVLEQDIICEEF